MKTLLLAVLLSAVPVAPASIAQEAAPGAVVASKYGLDTPVQDLVADPAAKAVLDADLPGLSTHPSFEMFKTMSLNQLVPYSQGRLTPEVLAQVGKNLAAIK